VANPQPDNGTTNIAHEIVEALMKVNLSPYESRIMWFIFRKTYGWSKKIDWISLSQFERCTGLDRRLVHRTLQGLHTKNIIIISRDDKMKVMYGFQKDYEKWVFPVSNKGGKHKKQLIESNQIDKTDLSSAEMMDATVIYQDDGVSSTKIPTITTIQNKEYICPDFSLEPAPVVSKKTKKSKDLSETDEFIKFYKKYPLKKARLEALKAWHQMEGKRPPIEIILGAIDRQIKWRASEVRAGRKAAYWKYPATWLRAGCWDDEVDENVGKKSKEWTDE